MSSFETFYEKQPPLLFVDELKTPLHCEKPQWFSRAALRNGEAPVNGIYIQNDFPDEENLLKTATDDFKRFSDIYEISGDSYPLILEYGKTSTYEEYIITVNETCCKITAEDTEGIRRGIIYIEDELQRREGPFLPLGEIKRKPRIKARITRGFFSPTNRPPKNIDELLDDVDYYPDEYLNRLAHDGTNGLWIYTRLADLVTTSIIPEYGEKSEIRRAKLKKIINRCKKYGIGIYVFFIDPAFLTTELAEKYPEIAGYNAMNSGKYTFCTHTEKGRQYCIEAMEKLCRLLPDVKGYIDITFGERPTSCASFGKDNCPRCKGYSAPEIVADVTDLLREGMRRADSKSDFISWTYGYRSWTEEQTSEFVHKLPNDAIAMENFEEMGVYNQLGKDRLAVDYWLSYVGPSDLFKAAYNTAKKEGKSIYAKMQVCCSHEIATVPYIPVPGILFDKYKYDLSGVMQCWYFGNYPSLMNKAAGELAFWHSMENKEEFLEYLAGIYCGSRNAKKLSEAWSFFEKGYTSYPVNIMFSYYGPMHDGVIWELQLKPKFKPLSRTWLYQDAADGDRINDCLQRGHTIEEVTTLLKTMKDNWNEGMKHLPTSLPKEQQTVTEALDLMISSGYNIMSFYALRFNLNDAKDKSSVLESMKKIIHDEIAISEKMIDVCNNDCRLGYHSEAESFKFFPAQLKKRIKSLNTLLDTEFAEVQKRIDDGELPLDWTVGYSDKKYILAKDIASAKTEKIADEDAFFKAAADEDMLYVDFKCKKDTRMYMTIETSPMKPQTPVCFHQGNKLVTNYYLGLPKKRGEEEIKKYAYSFTTDGENEFYSVKVSKKDISWSENNPLRIRIAANNSCWTSGDDVIYTLGVSSFPSQYAEFVCEK